MYVTNTKCGVPCVVRPIVSHTNTFTFGISEIFFSETIMLVVKLLDCVM